MEKPIPPPIHRNTKRTAELSGASFLLKAESLGLHVSLPWGDSERYDFIVDAGSRLWRIQLKSTEALRNHGFDIRPIHFVYGQGAFAYSIEDIDALVAHIIPKDTWYIIPVETFFPFKNLRLYPGIERRRARWEKYREAWHLLQPDTGRSA